jgi:hypothetical protein
LVAAALAAFSAAGLEVPPVEIHFADTNTDCRGHLGSFESTPNRTVIHICDPKDFVVAHEIAHVWVAVNVDDLDRHFPPQRRLGRPMHDCKRASADLLMQLVRAKPPRPFRHGDFGAVIKASTVAIAPLAALSWSSRS